MAKIVPHGKAPWVWAIRDCWSPAGWGNHVGIADRLVADGFTHAIVKIANGLNSPGVNFQTATETETFCRVLKARGLLVYGWAYVTGESPAAEAQLAAGIVKSWGLDGFYADMEGEFNTWNPTYNAVKGLAYSSNLRAALPGHVLALSSYRFPSSHPYFPWQILQYYDVHAPQVYEWGSFGPIPQLAKSKAELTAKKDMPFAPVASAYKYGGFSPSIEELTDFFSWAKANGPSASFWELGRVDKYWPELYMPLEVFKWLVEAPPPPPPKEIVTLANFYLKKHIYMSKWTDPVVTGANASGVLLTLPSDVPPDAKAVRFRTVLAVTKPGAYIALSPGSASLEERFRFTNMPPSAAPTLDLSVDVWPRQYLSDVVPLAGPRQVYMQFDAKGGAIRREIVITGWEV